jgi:hypothetical protein
MSTDERGPQHDFDFWIGEWEVLGPKGKQLGTSSITAVLGTGALAEHWHGNGNIEGRSLNSYDPVRDCWHQTWVDSSGSVLLLDGGLVDGSMVLEGLAPLEDGGPLRPQRITWSPQDDGVRQHWESRPSDAEPWSTLFDGHYRRV